MSKGTILSVVFFAVIAYLSISMIWTGSKYECEVCINYNGFDVCQTVEGMEKQGTIENGISTACAGAANGRTESMECGATPPTKVMCKEL